MRELEPTVWQRHEALAVLARLYPACARLRPPARDELRALIRKAGHAWTLVDPSETSGGYETLVAAGHIPFRDGSWHDVFNVLAFLRFPRAKTALHARVHALQCERGRAGFRTRSREEDALTLLDEAVIVVAGHESAIRRLEDVRRASDLDRMDDSIRSDGLLVTVFGHALLEHLVHDRAPIGAGVSMIVLPDEKAPSLFEVDAELARAISAGRFHRPMFGPSVTWPDPRVEAWCR